jgi:hypothetical protein
MHHSLSLLSSPRLILLVEGLHPEFHQWGDLHRRETHSGFQCLNQVQLWLLPGCAVKQIFILITYWTDTHESYLNLDQLSLYLFCAAKQSHPYQVLEQFHSTIITLILSCKHRRYSYVGTEFLDFTHFWVFQNNIFLKLDLFPSSHWDQSFLRDPIEEVPSHLLTWGQKENQFLKCCALSEHCMMGEVQKLSNAMCNIPWSEPFRSDFFKKWLIELR